MSDLQLATEGFPVSFDIEEPLRAFVSDFLGDELDPIFEATSGALQWLVNILETLLVGPPALVVIAVFTALAWWARDWQFATFTALAFSFVAATGFFEATMESLALVLVATVLAVAIGVPVGIAAARREKVSTAVRPVLDFMQTMPAFVYLLIALVLFNIGKAPGIVASLIFAMPPAVRLTELGIRHVDSEVVEAAEAFGAKPSEVLREVQLPLAMPTIMAGINQVIMLSLSMVVIAGLGGAGGIGADVVAGVTRFQPGLGLASGLAVVILAVFLDRTTSAVHTGPTTVKTA